MIINLIVKGLLLLMMFVGLPLLGISLAGKDIRPYLAFPPLTRYVRHHPFSWTAFFFLSALILCFVLPFFYQWLKRTRTPETSDGKPPQGFPGWGVMGLWVLAVSWFLAWTWFSWMGRLQVHTFTPLWIGFILTVNALTARRKGGSALIRHPLRFFLLFPVSACFWWFFEFLNRFVQNWFYTGVRFGPWEYFLHATLAFSTVLPAVHSMREFLETFPAFRSSFRGFMPIRFHHPRHLAWIALAFSAGGLTGIGIWPDLLFPLLWISPLLILVSLTTLTGKAHILSGAVQGHWHHILPAALSALACGLFWEMWNMYSLAKWEYAIPYVHAFKIFEMPLLGYAGYLPFGLECAVITDRVFPADPPGDTQLKKARFQSGQRQEMWVGSAPDKRINTLTTGPLSRNRMILSIFS